MAMSAVEWDDGWKTGKGGYMRVWEEWRGGSRDEEDE
jgi:hypothetical protein